MKNTDLIVKLVEAGASVIVENKSADLLKKIVRAARPDAEVTVRGAAKKDTALLLAVLKAAKCRVTFDLTD